MSDRPLDPTFAAAFDGAARIYAENFEALIGIVHPVETRPFPPGVWQHFRNRRKWYRTTDEFYVLQGDPEGVIRAIRATDAGPHQVIDVIGADPALDDPVYRAAGYLLDGVEMLMDRPITMSDREASVDPGVVSTLTSMQIDKLNEVWNNGRTANDYRPMLPAHNTAAGLVQRFIEVDGEPAAYGRAIVVDRNALLTDVNTFPSFRRRGLGRIIMLALQNGLAQAGATRVVLTATEMGLPLYEQLGYRTRGQVRIYVSDDEN